MSRQSSLSRSVAGFASVSLAIVGLIVLLMMAAEVSLIDGFNAFLAGAFGGRGYAYLLTTVSRTGLIVGMAMAAWISFRAGLFNIGGEGQLVLGGLVTALVAIEMPGPPALVIALAVASGMVAGGFWAVLAGALHQAAGVPLLIGSLLLNYPAIFLASWLVGHPLRDVSSGLPQTHLIPAERWLPYFQGTRLDVGVLFVLAATLLMILYGSTTTHGLKTRLVGLSPAFARSSGFAVNRLATQTLMLSGALAGLVGAVAVLGIHHRFSDGMLVQPLYAWTGIIAVLLVSLVPWAIPIAGFFFAALATGAAGMERTAGMPREIALIVQATVILFVAGRISSVSLSGQADDSGR